MEFVPHHHDLYTTPNEGQVTAEYDGPVIGVNRLPGEIFTLENFLLVGDRPFSLDRILFGDLQLQPISYIQLVFSCCNGNEWRAVQLASVYALNYLIAVEQAWLTQTLVLNIIHTAKVAIRDLIECDMRIVRDFCGNETLGDLLVMSAILCGVSNSNDYQKIAMLQLNYLRAQAVAQFHTMEEAENEFADHEDDAEDEGVVDVESDG